MILCEHGVIADFPAPGSCQICELEQEIAELKEAAEVLREERDEAWSVAESRTKQFTQMVELQEQQRRRHFQAMRKKQQEVNDARGFVRQFMEAMEIIGAQHVSCACSFTPLWSLQWIAEKEFSWLKDT